MKSTWHFNNSDDPKRYRLKKDIVIPAGTEITNELPTRRDKLEEAYEGAFNIGADDCDSFIVGRHMIYENPEYFEEISNTNISDKGAIERLRTALDGMEAAEREYGYDLANEKYYIKQALSKLTQGNRNISVFIDITDNPEIPAFASYTDGSVKEGVAEIGLNVGAHLVASAEYDIDFEDMLAENTLHELLHALQDLFDREFDEGEIEQAIKAVRKRNDGDKP